MRRKLRPLARELARTHPDIDDLDGLIRSGGVLVNGLPAANPATLVAAGSVTLRRHKPLRGEAKLRAALDAFGLDVHGRTALDVGAAAGGFTRVLLERGARRVYAVDAGHGQLLGSLRADPRVVDLERTNLAAVRLAEPVDFVTIDHSVGTVFAIGSKSVSPTSTTVYKLTATNAAGTATATATVTVGTPAPPKHRAVRH